MENMAYAVIWHDYIEEEIAEVLIPKLHLERRVTFVCREKFLNSDGMAWSHLFNFGQRALGGLLDTELRVAKLYRQVGSNEAPRKRWPNNYGELWELPLRVQ